MLMPHFRIPENAGLLVCNITEESTPIKCIRLVKQETEMRQSLQQGYTS
jgi:hypothetical protein